MSLQFLNAYQIKNDLKPCDQVAHCFLPPPSVSNVCTIKLVSFSPVYAFVSHLAGHDYKMGYPVK